jgi:hypothetical protein
VGPGNGDPAPYRDRSAVPGRVTYSASQTWPHITWALAAPLP